MADIFDSPLYQMKDVNLGTSIEIPQLDHTLIKPALDARLETQKDDLKRLEDTIASVSQVRDELLDFPVYTDAQAQKLEGVKSRYGIGKERFENIDLRDPNSIEKLKMDTTRAMNDSDIADIVREQTIFDGYVDFMKNNPTKFTHPELHKRFTKKLDGYLNGEAELFDINPAIYVPVDWEADMVQGAVASVLYDDELQKIYDEKGRLAAAQVIRQRSTKGLQDYFTTRFSDPRFRENFIADGMLTEAGELTEKAQKYIQDRAEFLTNRQIAKLTRLGTSRSSSTKTIDPWKTTPFAGTSDDSRKGRETISQINIHGVPVPKEDHDKIYDALKGDDATINTVTLDYLLKLPSGLDEVKVDKLPIDKNINHNDLGKKDIRYKVKGEFFSFNNENYSPSLHYSDSQVVGYDPESKEVLVENTFYTNLQDADKDLSSTTREVVPVTESGELKNVYLQFPDMQQKTTNRGRATFRGERQNIPVYQVTETQSIPISELPNSKDLFNVHHPYVGPIPFEERVKLEMRTDRHNNPTAFTTDIAKQAGLEEGVDYIKGDPFPEDEGGDKYHTAVLLTDDPVGATIKVIDSIGFFNDKDKKRWWTSTISVDRWRELEEKWKTATDQEKRDIVAEIYKGEGGQGTFNFNTPSQQPTVEEEIIETPRDTPMFNFREYLPEDTFDIE